VVNFGHQAFGGKVCVPDGRRVAFGVGSQIAHKYSHDVVFDRRTMVGNHAATDDILVHARTADFLAHAVDDEQIDWVYWDAWKQALGFFQQLVFGGLNFSGRYGSYDLGFVALIFHQSDTEGNRTALQNFSGNRQ